MSNLNLKNLLYVTQNTYKKKNSWVRNNVALLIKRWRKENPYRVIDYSKVKQFYDNQPQGIDLSKVKVGKYVVKFTEDYTVKGERWCEYHINFSSGTGMFRVKEWNDKYKFWRLEDYRYDYGNFSLDEDDINMYRFATKQEIEEFKIARKNYKSKKKEIEIKQKELSKLYSEL